MKFFALPLSLDFVIIARPVRPPTVGPAGHNISDFLSVNEKCNQRRRFSANLRTCTVQIRIFKCCVELRVSVNRNQFLSQLDHHFKQYEYSKKHRENDLAQGFVVGREGR